MATTRVLVIAGIGLAALGAAGAALLSSASADTSLAARLRSEKSIRSKIAEAEVRLADLITKANQDKRLTLIEKYLSFTDAAQFVSPRCDVKAKMLVDWMGDEKAPIEVRERARDALLNSGARSMNPDLAPGAKPSKRATFSLQYLVPLLKTKDSDEIAGSFANKVLNDYWYPSTQEKDIARYNPQDAATHTQAIANWKRFLAAR